MKYYIRNRSLKRLFSMGRTSSVVEDEKATTTATVSKEPAAAAAISAGSFIINDIHHRNQQQIETELRFSGDVTSSSEARDGPITLTPSSTFKCFSFEELFAATNGFSSENLVGRGGYAEVYRGVLELPSTTTPTDDYQDCGEEKQKTPTGTRVLLEVAVKKLTKASSEERREKEFLNEIGTMGHVSHPNVSSLLGCCIENGRFLVFQLSPNGSVASHLHDERLAVLLEWSTRYKIAVGTARGLNYLHKGCKRRIIHRDIKASNILLNHDFQPLISDFGLAKWLPTQWTHHSIAPIEGTVGYLAPEYFSHGIVSEETDVFAFGVFLLELISGKKPVDSSYQSLRAWAKPYLKQGDICKLVDSRLGSHYHLFELTRMAFAASLCIRASSACRPNMAQVLEILTGEEEIDKQRWEMAEEDEKHEELWGFEDLESDYEAEYSTFSTTSTPQEDDSVSSIGAISCSS